MLLSIFGDLLIAPEVYYLVKSVQERSRAENFAAFMALLACAIVLALQLLLNSISLVLYARNRRSWTRKPTLTFIAAWLFGPVATIAIAWLVIRFS